MPKIGIQNEAQQLAKSLEVLGIEKYESEALNKLLEAFYVIVRKKDGEDNERDIFRVLIIAVDRYLDNNRPIIDKEHKNPIIRDGEFKSSSQILRENPHYSSARQRQAAEQVSHDTRKNSKEENKVIFCFYITNKKSHDLSRVVRDK